jgi:hypothetical protein
MDCPQCVRDGDGRVSRGGRVGRRPGRIGGAAADGGAGLQEHPGDERRARRRIPWLDGLYLQCPGGELHLLSPRRRRRRVGRVREGQRPEAARAADDRDDERAEQAVLRRPPGRDLRHVPQRWPRSCDDQDTRCGLRHADDRRTGEHYKAGARGAVSGPGARQVRRGNRRRRPDQGADQLGRQGHVSRLWRRAAGAARDLRECT